MTNKNELSEVVKEALNEKMIDLYTELERYESKFHAAEVAEYEATKEKNRWYELVEYKQKQITEIEKVLG